MNGLILVLPRILCVIAVCDEQAASCMFHMQHHAPPPATPPGMSHVHQLPDQMESAALAGVWQGNCATNMLADFEHEMDMSTLWTEVGMQKRGNVGRAAHPEPQLLPHLHHRHMLPPQDILPNMHSPFSPAPRKTHWSHPPTPRDLFFSYQTLAPSPFHPGVAKIVGSRAIDNSGQTLRRPEVLNEFEGSMDAGGDRGVRVDRTPVEAAADRLAHFEGLFRLSFYAL